MSDAAARDLSQDPQRQVLLQAPAGSGKTTVLVQRFLRVLAIVDEPEQVLAITFTRKAAAEMRDRVLLAIEDRLPQGHAEPQRWQDLREQVLAHARERNWDLLELPTRLRIQTIDSLNHELARAMPLLGRLQSSLDVVDDAHDLYLQAARNTLRGTDADQQQLQDIDGLLRRLDNDWDRAELLLAGLLASRGRWLPVLLDVAPLALADRIEASLARIINETLLRTTALLGTDLLARSAALARASARNRQDAGDLRPGAWRTWLAQPTQLDAHSASLPAWQAVVDLALTGEDTLRKLIDVRSGFPKEDKPLKARWQQWRDDLQDSPDVHELLRTIRSLPQPQVDATERGALALLARVLLQAAIQLKLVFSDSGKVDHNEVAAVARQALTDMGEPTELSLRQTLRVHHLLVDEYQDISPEQKALIEALTVGWDAGDARSLFLVGDPMQSIYLFRDSEVGLFLQARSTGVAGIRLQSLQLTRNFRSAMTIVDWVNVAFHAAFPAAEDVRASAVPYLSAEAVRGEPMFGGATVTTWPQASDDPWPEALQIAAECARLLAAQPQMRCAILLQTRSTAPRILRALREAGVPALGVDLAPLSDLVAVRDIVSLARAMQHAGDRTAWLSALRAPFCGLTLRDLHALCADDPDALLVDCIVDTTKLARVSEDGNRRLARCAPLLLQAHAARRREHLATHVETLWHQLGGPAGCQDDTELRAVRQYLLALRDLEQSQPAFDAGQLQALATRLRAGSDSAPGGTVEVLTIHHAKGLEWDAVFLPGLGRRVRSDSPPLLRWLQLPAVDGSQDLLMAVHSIGEQVSSDPLSGYIRRLQKQRQDNERKRLAYVAVTRARERLYLSGHAPWSAKESIPKPRAGSQLEIIWPAVQATFTAVGAAPGGPPTDRANTAAPWYRLDAGYVHAPRRQMPMVESLVAGFPASVTRPEFSWAGPLARAVGTLVHAELELLAQTEDPAAIDFTARLPLYLARLRELGVEARAANAAAGDIAERMAAVTRDPRAKWLLSPRHAEAHCELRLSGVLDGQLRNIVIDRSFVDEQGQRWVIDYKTSSHGGGDLAGFLAAERERYRSQLQLYVRLASGLGPQPVRAALFFPWLGELLEVS